MKLMLAEDEPGLSRALTAILQHSDYEVDTALDGLTALEYLLTNDYDAATRHYDARHGRHRGAQAYTRRRKATAHHHAHGKKRSVR